MKSQNLVKNNSSGFTILEIMIATIMVAIIGGVATLFAGYFMQSYSFSFDENQNINQAQQAMTVMIRQIRKTRNGDDGSWPIITAEDNNFTFYSDIDGDGRTDRIRYFLNGTMLQKGVIPPTQVPVTYPSQNEVISTIVNNIDTSTAPLFTYYNGEWPDDTVSNPLSGEQRIVDTRYVDVNIRINTSSGSGSIVTPFQLTSGVQIRSLKDNL